MKPIRSSTNEANGHPAPSPQSRSRAALPENIRATLEASNLPIEVATAIADLCERSDKFAPSSSHTSALQIVRANRAAQLRDCVTRLAYEHAELKPSMGMSVPGDLIDLLESVLSEYMEAAQQVPYPARDGTIGNGALITAAEVPTPAEAAPSDRKPTYPCPQGGACDNEELCEIKGYCTREKAAPCVVATPQETTAALRYLHISTAPDGQWADQAVHGFVGAMLKTAPAAQPCVVMPWEPSDAMREAGELADSAWSKEANSVPHWQLVQRSLFAVLAAAPAAQASAPQDDPTFNMQAAGAPAAQPNAELVKRLLLYSQTVALELPDEKK